MAQQIDLTEEVTTFMMTLEWKTPYACRADSDKISAAHWLSDKETHMCAHHVMSFLFTVR